MFRLHPITKRLQGGARRIRPSLEALEGRLAPASNVTASVVGGNLTITDNAATSSLTLSQPAANEVTITPGAGITINGKSGPVTLSGVSGGLNVNLGTGNDTLTFDLSHHNFNIGFVSITGTTGSKTILTNDANTTNFLNVAGSYSENLGTAFGFTQLHQFNVGESMTFDHDNGTSLVFLGVDSANMGKMFNHVGGNLTAQNVTKTGAVGTGVDVYALEETNVGGDITAKMGTGDSTGFAGWTTVGSLSSKSVNVGGNVDILGKSGFLVFGDVANDGEEVANAHIAGNVIMDLGSGVGNTALFGNSAEPSATSANNVVIMGSGAHDSVAVLPAIIHGDLAVALVGGGAGSISVDDVAVTGDTALTALGGGNSIAIDNQLSGSTFGGGVGLFMGGSNNLLQIASHTTGGPTTTFSGPVFANLGAGNDALILAQAGNVDFGDIAVFLGGTGGGNHAFVNHGNLEGTHPTLINF
jgi:hypothetical protein